MERRVAFIGFGEAAQAFADALPLPARAYDRKTDDAALATAMRADYARLGVDGAASPAEALAGADVVLSLVTADQALAAARDDAPLLAPGALWLDMNSVAPDTKRTAARAVQAAGGRYVDVAILAPVHPQRRAVPLLASGLEAEAGAAALAELGFSDVRIVPGGIGTASAIKMVRSIMVKGLEALTTEWLLAAEAAGIRGEAVAALDSSWPGTDWQGKAIYNLERMMTHGRRRAAEMDEVAAMLDGLGTGAAMTRAAADRQRAIGALGLSPDATPGDLLAALVDDRKDRAA